MSDVFYYVFCAVCACGVLLGIAMMSRVKTAAAGNLTSALCTLAAIGVTLVRYNLLASMAAWCTLALATVVGVVAAYRVKMIEMPQVVALLNGLGGAASALVAVSALITGLAGVFSLATAGLALAVGMITLAGSAVAAGKLHKLLPQKPVVWRGHAAITAAALLAALACVVCIALGAGGLWMVLLCAAVSAFWGVAFAVRVGGADMPITISLLNSLSGVAGAIAGMAVADPLLVAVGGIVGASGLLLTQIMCKAMNRRLADILFGKAPAAGAAPEKAAPSPADALPAAAPVQQETRSPAEILAGAKDVIIVPGYGMALAQAQEALKKLADALEAKGATVRFAIHPVAGRMPGHMNVLLCEVDVPYEQLFEMEDINPAFAQCDVALVVGANDVVNPAAGTAEGTPIYGMPVLDVAAARHVLMCNYDDACGYAGVPNPLYTKESGVSLLFGDAGETLEKLLAGF